MPYKLFQVDAFTHQAFKGNPAAVCMLQKQETDEWMQALAAEMALSETAFLSPEGDAWRLRWFTPRTEVRLCGHATLASAMVLFELQPELRDTSLKFNTLSGTLLARWSDGKVELDFPAMAPEPAAVDRNLESALGIRLLKGVQSGDYFLFEAEDDPAVRAMTPDFNLLEGLPMPEVIVTARSADPEFDFISRFFAPRLGINEDPVTGSAHCLLAPFWAEKMGKSAFKAYQASARGGVLEVCLADGRVFISGAAVLIFQGELFV